MRAVLRRESALAASYGVDWWTERIATSGVYNDSRVDIRDRWTFADTVEAHAALDCIAAVRAEAVAEAREEAERG